MQYIFFLLAAVSFLFGLGGLYAITLGWKKSLERVRKANMTPPPRWQAAAGGIFFIAASVLLLYKASLVHSESFDGIKDIPSAQAYMVGTWTHTEPIDFTDSFPTQWERWDIHPDGNVDVYSESPRSDSWGEPDRYTYTVFTDKYADTGERYYGIRINDTGIVGILRGENIISMHILNNPKSCNLKRGMVNPFSQ